LAASRSQKWLRKNRTSTPTTTTAIATTYTAPAAVLPVEPPYRGGAGLHGPREAGQPSTTTDSEALLGVDHGCAGVRSGVRRLGGKRVDRSAGPTFGNVPRPRSVCAPMQWPMRARHSSYWRFDPCRQVRSGSCVVTFSVIGGSSCWPLHRWQLWGSWLRLIEPSSRTRRARVPSKRHRGPVEGCSGSSTVCRRARLRLRRAQRRLCQGRKGLGWVRPGSLIRARARGCRWTHGCGSRASARSTRRR
jgi:hypothetical protein